MPKPKKISKIIPIKVQKETADKGHVELINDIVDLWKDAMAFEFHDFKNKRYAVPKAALIAQFKAFTLKIADGGYDN